MSLATTLDSLDTWWAAALGCDVSDFQQGHTVVAVQGIALSGYPGVLALARKGACLISAPPTRVEPVRTLVAGQSPSTAFAGDILQYAFAPAPSTVIGPAWLGYADHTDAQPADSRGARRLTHGDTAALRTLEAACDPLDWRHSGIVVGHELLFGLFHGPVLVAAGTGRRGEEGVLDMGILTHPAYRGHGYGRAVVSAMTAYGLAHGHVLRYRTLQANVPSRRIARVLGYQEYGLTIAIRPADDSAAER